MENPITDFQVKEGVRKTAIKFDGMLGDVENELYELSHRHPLPSLNVYSNLVTSCGAALSRIASHENERMKEVRLDAAGRKLRFLRLEKHDANNVVANVTLPLQLNRESIKRTTIITSTPTFWGSCAS